MSDDPTKVGYKPTEGNTVSPFIADFLQRVRNVHWLSPRGVVIIVTIDQGAATSIPEVINQDTVTFKQAPANGESITYNDVKIVAGTDFSGATAALAAKDFAAFLNKYPKPIPAINRATVFNDTTVILQVLDVLTVEYSGSSIVVIGSTYTAYPKDDIGKTLDVKTYGGFAMYDPLGFNGYLVDSELAYNSYAYILGSNPVAFKTTNIYRNRIRRTVIFDTTNCIQGEIIVEGRQGSLYFTAPGEPDYGYVELQWFSMPSYITAKCYPPSTSFTVGDDGTLSVIGNAKMIWSFMEMVDPDTLLNPYKTIIFDKNGEVK